jgi:ribonuclease HI
MVTVYIDGASRGNPGEAGIGIIIKSDKGTTLYSASGYAGKLTNNQAEYNALIAALTKIRKNPSLITDGTHKQQTHIIVYSDSELLVKQLHGHYKVKEPELKRLRSIAGELIQSIPSKIEFKHIRREQNRDADRLANIGIDSKIPLAI